MRARFRGPGGTGVLSLDDEATVGQVFDQIREKSGIGAFSLKYGYPLQTLEVSQKDETARSLGLNGETLTIVPEESAAPRPAPAPAPASASAPAPSVSSASFGGLGHGPVGVPGLDNPQPPAKGPEGVSIPWAEREGTLREYLHSPARAFRNALQLLSSVNVPVTVLRVMPDDNSCLFTAFGGALPKQIPVPELRRMVADYVLAHQDEYNEGILSMPPHEYATKIQGRDRWGGAIEMAIFSRLFDVQIYTIDVKGQNPYTFGEDKESRCILVYSGIHYDRVAFSPSEPPFQTSDLPPELDRTLWPIRDTEVLDKAQSLVAQLNEMHYYTDPTEILLRCDVPGCEWIGSGEKAGSQHAQQTGHTALQEIEDNALLKCNAPGCDWLGSGESEAKKHTSDSGHSSLSVIPDF